MTIEDFKIKLLPLKDKMYRMSFYLLKNEDDAMDTVQEVFLKIWNMKSDFIQIKNIEAFTLKVTRNYCLDKIKSKSNKHLSLIEDTTQTEIDPYDQMESNDLIDKVKRTLKILPEQQKSLVILKDIEGYEINEIQDITGWDLNYIRVNLSRGRKKIKETIMKIQEYEKA
jgi:RNA polymerase sigma-70 factor (ECF subfamily)